MSYMFKINGETVKTNTVLRGKCQHACAYCWVEELKKEFSAMRKVYAGEYWLSETELAKIRNNRYMKGDTVFIADTNDLFAEAVPVKLIKSVLHETHYNNATFLFCTKNPVRYSEFLHLFKKEDILGATIETDSIGNYDSFSRAPAPSKRIAIMQQGFHSRKMISIEPIFNFSGGFASKLIAIKPELVFVGYDNYKKNLPEPSLKKTQKLINDLRSAGINVIEKTLRKAWWENE